MGKSKWVRLLVGTAIGLGLLGYTLNEVNWALFSSFFQNINWPVLALAVAATWLYLLIKAWRWKILLESKLDLPHKRVWQSSVIGATFNILLPYLGEVVRAVRVGRGKEKSFILTTVGLEKILDSALLLLVIYIFSYQLQLPDWFKNGISIFTFMVLTASSIILIIKGFRSKLPDWIKNILVSRLLGWNLLLRAFLVTILSWFVLALVYGLAAASLGIYLSFWSYLFLVCLLYLGLSIPSAPGYVGSYQFLIWIGLGFFGVTKELALAYSFVVYLVLAAPTAVLGWYYLARD